jgi:hypothetical protein
MSSRTLRNPRVAVTACGGALSFVAVARVVVAFALLGGAGCATALGPPPPKVAPPPPAAPAPAPAEASLPDLVFRAGEPPWRALGVSVVIGSPASLETSLDVLGAKLGLTDHIGRRFLEGMTSTSEEELSGVKLTPQILDLLDRARPVVFIMLGPGIGVSSGDCWGLAFRDAAGARRGLALLGVETSRAGGESTRRLPDGTAVVAGVHGRTLLFSTTPKTLAVAGPLVEALQAGHVEHVASVAVYPQIFPVGADVIGAGFESGLVAELEKTRAEQRAKRGPAPRFAVTDGLIATARHLARRFAQVVADTRVARLELDLDDRVGFALRVAFEPVEGSALARTLTPPTPFGVDPRLRGSSAPYLLSWGAPPGGPSVLDDLFEASGPAGKALHAEHDKWRRLFAGPGSCAHGLPAAPAAWLCAQPFARGVKAAEVVRRYAAVSKALTAWLHEIGVAASLPRSVAAARPEAGLYAGAPERKAAEAALAARIAPAPPPPALASLLAHAEGADVIVALDLVRLLTDGAATLPQPDLQGPFAKLGALQGFTAVRASFGLTARSGARAAYELQVPFETLRDVITFVRPYLTGLGALWPAPDGERATGAAGRADERR